MEDYKKMLDGVTYIDGGMIYWYIAHLTQPNNDRLAEGFFEGLKVLHVKNFKFSVKNMLSRFKELCIELNNHGVTYDVNTKQLDFWRCLETMREREFCSFVNREREVYRQTDMSTRKSVDDLIPVFLDK